MGILGADIAPIPAGVAGQEVEEADLALLQQIKVARATADEVHRSTQARAERMQRIAAAVALFAALAAAALTVVMVRTLRLELGGEPAEARQALGRVAGWPRAISAPPPGMAWRAD